MSRKWLRTFDAAEHLQLKPATLINYRHRKVGPRYAKLGSIVVYDMTDLDAWAVAQRIEPGASRIATMEVA